uniref:Glutamate rich 2 n=2 Tax=Otolemur garnettii TaxID=30611 RepID=H0XFR3_OTOGA
MDTDLPIPPTWALVKGAGARAQVGQKVCAPTSQRRTLGPPACRSARPLAPHSQRPPKLTPAPPRPLTLFPALPGSPGSPRLRPTPLASTLQCSWGSRGARPCLYGDAASQAPSPGHCKSGQLGWPSVFASRTVGLARPPSEGLTSSGREMNKHSQIIHSRGPEFRIPEIPRNYLDKTDAIKAPKNRQNGGLLVFDLKEKAMIEPNEAKSDKCLFGHRPRLASKFYTLPTRVSLNVAKTLSEKKEVSSKTIENKISLKNPENRVSSTSIENKSILNLQSDLWSSSFLKESTGKAGKDTVIAKQEKNNESCLQDTDSKLSESTDDDEDDTNDEDNNESSNAKKDTCAPLELMAEFLRAEMGGDYHLAKKLCQMILIYEPENPEAKEFFALIEEMLQMEKAQNLKKDDEESEEDSSEESEGESSEDEEDDSSDECEEGS